MWDRLVSKYVPHTALSLLKLKSTFHDSLLESMKKEPNEWILYLEGLQICMNKFGLKGNITDKDFMTHVLNNLPKEYNLILGLEIHLSLIGVDVLTIDVICKKIDHQYKKIKKKK